MKSFNLESELAIPVCKYLHRKGYLHQRQELDFFNYSIDLYGVDRQGHNTVAVELKLYKWRRAFQQARLYQLCADFVYMALPNSSCGRITKELLLTNGIGLIAISPEGNCRKLIDPQKSKVIRKRFKQDNIKRIKKGF